ncbi:PolC-type DNA polymerase III [Anaerobacillus isosaccharinicus]|uniref:DNA polymerase III PolC-type n=1 Tax=Anaerobacillus isosaccharinicus TaxID=1532552 RepID=A0A1S2M9C0_9BACI|nr:PolC-type DNA polymerase III [Anaerobacillus isosaccharinicus]MBA5587297.1 PolC-type DNA polymerase III [Anaerobacillus isosaccharinicus]QOY34511.1 PolC-type DNA polymerase III [Anaerobacillus isosaccharinicus]
MSEEKQIRQERFQLLLQQILFPTDLSEQFFKDGLIHKLTIYKNEKKWQFDFQLEKPLPFQVFQIFQERLGQAFGHIASVTFTLSYSQNETNEALIVNYWPFLVESLEGFSPSILHYLKGQTPTIQGQKLTISVRNETEGTALSRKLREPLKEAFLKYGFPNYQLETAVKQSKKEFQQFVEQKEQEDHSKSVAAMIEKQKLEKRADKIAQSGQALTIGYQIKDDIVPINSIQDEEKKIAVQGYVFDAETRELRSGRTLLTFKITDYTDSILIKIFSNDKEDVPLLQAVKKGMWVKVRGGVQHDTFVRDLVMMAKDINEVKPVEKQDLAPENEKRVELHLHTPMSQMDAITPCSRIIEQASKWGHKAIAITDHGIVQSFPEAYGAGKKHGVKILYGLEANLVDDGVPIAYNTQHRKLSDEIYIVFDVETTGLSAVYNTIIELAAVKIRNGEIIDRFESFANPHEKLTNLIIDLTGITDDMLVNAPEIEDVLKDFRSWIGDDILVAHNASFDMGFINAGFRKIGLSDAENPVIDTLELARFLYPELKNHRLNNLCKKFDIELVSHHRAIYDAEATGYLMWKLLKDCFEREIEFHDQLNDNMGKGDFHRLRPSHCILLAKTQAGLKNLYKLVSFSHLEYFFRTPRIPRSLLQKYREGIIVGSGCDKGEVFEAMMQKSNDEVEKIAKFYDYLEIQPPSNYNHLIEKEIVRDELALKEITTKIVALGEKLGKPVVATGNVHYLTKNDAIYRKILIASQGGANPLNKQTLPEVHFRTTDEMLEIFGFLGEEKAKEVVVTNTQKVADEIEEIKPIPDDLYTPKIEGADEEIRNMSYNRARSIYGENLPEIVEARIEKELKSIIGHGFAVIYLISHKLVKKSLDDGYLVGSRGSVGSSFVATMTEITEVNPLPPHYVCPSCHHSHFFDDGSVGSGFDLPDKDCPQCGTKYVKDGHDIPFETFLGFKGDKVPDIDLNFSGDYQPKAHNYTKELFGEEFVYKAGTIGTVAEKTAYGYVKGYQNDFGLQMRGAEIDRLVSGCTGVKRTTGQHPGGIIVVPDYMEIYDFCPIQFPADDKTAEWKTTHFDFHSIHDNMLKLDILGHDDPTVIRMLQDLSGMDPKTIPTDDAEVFKLFSGTEALGVTEEQIMCKTGTYGIPEFGTKFVRQMLEETKPSTFSELVQISGLSHGTDVWLNNANELIYNGTCVLKEVIGCRDDIMVYLIYKGLEPSLAFKIMENVRKGKGLPEEWIDEMKKNNVPDWYIGSCLKIKYMFPKAHAAAYVLMAVRIAYFKVHHPILFYAAYFTVRADDFDLDTMIRGSASIRAKLEEISQKGLDASPKEKSLQTVLELALEMVERGYSFKRVDLYKSSATDFIVEGDTLLPPFNAMTGVGTNAALNIVKAREQGEFLSKEDLQQRSKITKTVLENLNDHGCLEGMPDSNQLSLF